MAAAMPVMSVLIVGGMTGATLALAISHLTSDALPVHLIEAQDPHSSRHHGTTTGRSPAAGTCRQLARIGPSARRLAERATRPSSEYTSATAVMPGCESGGRSYGLSALGQCS